MTCARPRFGNAPIRSANKVIGCTATDFSAVRNSLTRSSGTSLRNFSVICRLRGDVHFTPGNSHTGPSRYSCTRTRWSRTSAGRFTAVNSRTRAWASVSVFLPSARAARSADVTVAGQTAFIVLTDRPTVLMWQVAPHLFWRIDDVATVVRIGQTLGDHAFWPEELRLVTLVAFIRLIACRRDPAIAGARPFVIARACPFGTSRHVVLLLRCRSDWTQSTYPVDCA